MRKACSFIIVCFPQRSLQGRVDRRHPPSRCLVWRRRASWCVASPLSKTPDVASAGPRDFVSPMISPPSSCACCSWGHCVIDFDASVGLHLPTSSASHARHPCQTGVARTSRRHRTACAQQCPTTKLSAVCMQGARCMLRALRSRARRSVHNCRRDLSSQV